MHAVVEHSFLGRLAQLAIAAPRRLIAVAALVTVTAGRVVTAAALVMSISFAALIAADVSFMRMFGLGLTLAVLTDATLVRMVLMPAFMHGVGEWNWWAPKWLSRFHDRFGLDESSPVNHTVTGVVSS